jgi:2-iminoacetate synthase ThiH
MPTRYTLVCDDDLAAEVRQLAREYDLTEEEVLRQLVDLGLDATDDRPT